MVDPPTTERQAFLGGLRELGHVVGRNLVIEYRSAAWNRELLPELAAELVERARWRSSCSPRPSRAPIARSSWSSRRSKVFRRHSGSAPILTPLLMRADQILE
jgi:hypothetical protein